MTSEELAISIIQATGGDIKRAKEAASVIDAWEAARHTCNHKHYSFDQHGRRCTCGELMVDFGD